MAEKRFVLPDATPVTMTGDAAARLIGSGDGDAALLYIYIIKNRGELSAAEAAADLKMTAARVNAAVSSLASLGLLSHEAAAPRAPASRPADELPQYETADVRRELENGGEFAALAGEVQRSLGKVLSSADLSKLFGIYDHLGLPPEVILMLVSHCAGETHRRYGEGRAPTMRFIEAAAFTWEREGVASLEAAEEYIKRQSRRRSAMSAIERAVGITGREPTRTEREYLSRWLDMGHSPDAVALAYDKTVTQTGRLVWKYMDRILSDWHGKNLHTAEEASNGDKKPTASENRIEERPPASDAEALASMKRFLEKLRKE